MIGVADMKYTGSSQVIKFSKKKVYYSHGESSSHVNIWKFTFPKKNVVHISKKRMIKSISIIEKKG